MRTPQWGYTVLRAKLSRITISNARVAFIPATASNDQLWESVRLLSRDNIQIIGRFACNWLFMKGEATDTAVGSYLERRKRSHVVMPVRSANSPQPPPKTMNW